MQERDGYLLARCEFCYDKGHFKRDGGFFILFFHAILFSPCSPFVVELQSLCGLSTPKSCKSHGKISAAVFFSSCIITLGYFFSLITLSHWNIQIIGSVVIKTVNKIEKKELMMWYIWVQPLPFQVAAHRRLHTLDKMDLILTLTIAFIRVSCVFKPV